MKTSLPLLFLTLVLTSAVHSDEVLSTNTKIFSENKKYYANIGVRSSGTCEMQMYDNTKDYELWSSWIEWTRFLDGFVSNDGSVLVVVNKVYSDRNNLVMVYRKLKQEAYSTRAIRIPKEYLRTVNDKPYWVKNVSDYVQFEYGSDGAATNVYIATTDGRILAVPLD